MDIKFKKGDRVEVIKCDDYQKAKYKYEVGYIGTINEDDSENPFVFFDEEISNYTSLGTAVDQSELKLIV